MFPAVAQLFIFGEDLASRDEGKARRMRSIVLLAFTSAIAIAIPLLLPIMDDLRSLAGKVGGHHAGLYTVSRTISIFAGGFSDAVTALIAAVAGFGLWRSWRSDARLAAYMAAIAVVPAIAIVALGAQWSHVAVTFGRYLFPVQLMFLFWFAFGTVALARALARSESPRVETGAAVAVAALYLALNPAIAQVTRLGPWYGHIINFFDPVPDHNAALAQYDGYPVPEFYRRLAALPPGEATLVEAPFTSGAPANAFAYLARFHRQREIMGMLHDLCLDGPRVGEPPNDSRFSFHNFVFLSDPSAVASSGARYIVLHLDQRQGAPFVEADRCVKELTRLYGPPVEKDARVAVFDLRSPRDP
jgi:hypothetical protein